LCEPATIGLAISAASAVGGFAAQQQKANAVNAASKQNAINASVAASNSYADEGRKFIYNMRETQQQGYGATMKGREAQGTGAASGGASGFDASSLSIGDIMSNEAQRTAANLDNIMTKQDDRKSALKSTMTGIEAQAQGRINAMPGMEDPSPLGLAINLAGATATYGEKKGWFKE
jgi:hypothetical protein